MATALTSYYKDRLTSLDPAERELAAAQLQRLEGASRAPRPMSAADQPEGGIVALIAQTVHLHRRANDSYEGPCPWHSSKSGTCLVVWPDDGRWWCSSCKRGGDATAWYALLHDVSRAGARIALDLPLEVRQQATRQHQTQRTSPRHAATLPDTWRPTATTLPDDWRPGAPLPQGCGS